MNNLNLVQQLAPGFSGVNIGITVFLFIMFWPLALVMLAYIVYGARLGLDFSRPETIGTFFRRVGTAWRAAVASFKNPSA